MEDGLNYLDEKKRQNTIDEVVSQVGLSHLRASVCKYRKPGASCEIFSFLIFCLNKPFSELFSKIQLRVPKAL